MIPGPLTSGGKMCRRCRTINRCRVTRAGFVCDGCVLPTDEAWHEVYALAEINTTSAADAVLRMFGMMPAMETAC